jgi:S1-C subfamily serine protease
MFIKTIVRVCAFLLILVIFCSCAMTASGQKGTTLPRQSFIHLNKNLNIKSCNHMKCMSVNLKSYASGFVVNVNPKGSFVVTAAHFCVDKVPYKGVETNSTYKAKRLDGDAFDAEVLEYEESIDTCLIFVKDLTTKVFPVSISNEKPLPGEKIYNIAAPLGIYASNMVPILEGRYNGDIEYTGKEGTYNMSVYTLPAAPGSSGSMILNSDGKLVGVVLAVYTRFHVITLSITYEDLVGFIKNMSKKHMSYKESMTPLIPIPPIVN